jgi:hypothetical protein
VPGSILGATKFSAYQWVWNEAHSALVRINEELLERKVLGRNLPQCLSGHNISHMRRSGLDSGMP